MAGSDSSLFLEKNFNIINYVSLSKNIAVKLNRIILWMEDYFSSVNQLIITSNNKKYPVDIKKGSGCRPLYITENAKVKYYNYLINNSF